MSANQSKQTSIMVSDPRKALLAWRVFFSLAVLQTIFCIFLLLTNASALLSQLTLTISEERLAVISVVFLPLILFTWLLIASWAKPLQTERQIKSLVELPENHPPRFGILAVVCGAAFVICLYSIVLTPEISEPFTATIFSRFLPVIILFAGLLAQFLIVLVWIKFGSKLSDHQQYPHWLRENWVFWLSLVCFCLIFLLWGWVVRNTFRTEAPITGWNDLGIPIIETQVLLAWLVGMATWGFLLWANRNIERHAWLKSFKPRLLDSIIFLTIWIITAFLWNITPALPNYFLSTPRQPNFEYYPHSDALVYDMSAQVLMNGEGLRFANDIYVRRPILALFFTGLHILGGQDTNKIIFWQILFLAVTPSFIYLLGKTLNSRMAGVIAAMLIMLRGENAITLGNKVTSSSAKLLMADAPAMLAMVIFTFVAVRWLQSRSKNLGLLAGGLLGIAILLRTELVAATGAVLLISFFVFSKQPRVWLVNFLIFGFGISLILAPWVYRNWSLTGKIFIDTPTFRTDSLQERYKINLPAPDSTQIPTLAPAKTPQGNSENLFSKANFDLSSSSIGEPTPVPGQTSDGTSTSAGSRGRLSQIASFIITHFANSQVQILLTLPTTFRPVDNFITFLGHHSIRKLWYDCCSTSSYIRRLPYWHKWLGVIPSEAYIPLIINLVLMGIGFQASWKRLSWTGLLPLSISIFHLSINALARNSGGRYLMPVDWIWIVYFSLGLAVVSIWTANLFTKEKLTPDIEIVSVDSITTPTRPEKNILRTPQFYLIAVFLLLTGCAAPVLERTIPPRYSDQSQTQMLQNLMNSSDLSADQKQAINNLINHGAIVSSGRGLYPNYYVADQGEPGTPDPFEPKPFARLGFYLARKNYEPVSLPMVDGPSVFPNGADTLIISCPNGETALVALFNAFNEPPIATYFRSGDLPSLTCK